MRSELHDKKWQLWQARQDSEAAVAAFTTKRSALEANIKTQKQEVPTTGGSAPTSGIDFVPSYIRLL
jgi:hypothetical protein